MTTLDIPKQDYTILLEKNVSVPMRDGTVLRADVFRPDVEGQFPVIIERTMLWKGEGGDNQCHRTGSDLAPRGYVYIAQDVRGAFESEGEFTFAEDDGWGIHQDGFDTIEWAAQQPWCNGNVGMVGACNSGMTQSLAAPTRPPHLKALFILVGGAHRNYFFRDNVYRLSTNRGVAFWYQLHQLQHPTASPEKETVRSYLEKTSQDPNEMAAWFRHLPLKSFPPAESWQNWFFKVMDHPENDAYWSMTDVSLKFNKIDVPIFHVAGWFDLALNVSLNYFSGIQKNGLSEQCRKVQRLIVGPWGHLNTGERKIGEIDFGPEAVIDVESLRLKWHDYWLKGIDNGVIHEPCVRVFLMGDNRWVDLATWPPAEARYEPMYFREGSERNNTSLNDGRLTFEMPENIEKADSFVYDPENPIPSLASDIDALPMDYRSLEARMLTYTSDVLDKPLTIIGPVKTVLLGQSSAKDTDWVVRLCDVWPDGRSISVCDGVMRARYRNSLEHEELLEPGMTYRFDVDMWATAQTFQPGHRIRVQVTSSDFPRYDRNLNTGGAFGEEVCGQTATNTIFHDALRPSHILLPVIS